MSTDTDPAAEYSQRGRALRKADKPAVPARPPAPPRQRRPALAALAVVLIVGGALIAGLLAIRMDSREPVLAAARDIEAGSLITEEDLREVQVASEGLPVISTDFAADILDGGTYARVPIGADSLVDQNMLTEEAPVGDDRAIVALPLTAALTPTDELRSGDLVEVVRISGGQGENTEPTVLTQALVLAVNTASSDDLGGAASGSVSLLVPTTVTSAVIDAAGTNLAGLALLARGQATDVELQAETP